MPFDYEDKHLTQRTIDMYQ